jgi:hypothetical protein
MKLWKKNKRVERELPSFINVGLYRFNQKLIAFAAYLQHKTNSYSKGSKKLVLLLFIIVFVTKSITLFVHSIKGSQKKSIAISRIKTIPVEREEPQTLLITKSEFLKIQKFKYYIDSLSTTAKGKKIKDSLLINRPQLMDSVNFLVSLYLEQLKSKVK